jgi:septum formation protein
MSGGIHRANPKLILASASPRRAELLRHCGYEFEAATPPLAEPDGFNAALPPELQAEALSFFKASAVSQAHDQGVILGADTVVALGLQVFGKPRDADDAYRILSTLAGTEHQVITGVTVLEARTGRRRIAHDVTRIRMRRLLDAHLRRYIDSGGWEGKAGAYGIQDQRDPFVERVEGSFTNVVGLPMELVAELLVDFGFDRTPARPQGQGNP